MDTNKGEDSLKDPKEMTILEISIELKGFDEVHPTMDHMVEFQRDMARIGALKAELEARGPLFDYAIYSEDYHSVHEIKEIPVDKASGFTYRTLQTKRELWTQLKASAKGAHVRVRYADGTGGVFVVPR